MTVNRNILIRRATDKDAPALKAILYDTYASTWLPELTREAAGRFRDEDRPGVYFGARGALFWIAACDGEPVGFVDWDGDFVNALHVRASHARMGIGAKLMDLAEAEIARAGFGAVRLETDTFNTRALAFYAKRGYREADTYSDTEWESGLTTLLLIKSLR
ncbi:MAG: N-acetyltransferase family protein [Hyphomonadaceae bacterium]